MTRFVIANRRRGLFRPEDKIRSRMSVAMALDGLASAQVLEDLQPEDPTARRVTIVEADPLEIENKLAELPADVIVEPEILHLPTIVPPPDLERSIPPLALPADALADMIEMVVTGGGVALADANVILHTRSLGGVTKTERRTNARGRVTFTLAPGHTLAAALVIPSHGYWTMVARGAQITLPIECPPLPAEGPLGWWHQMLGTAAFDATAGAGIKVGVVDSGLGANDALAAAIGIGAFIDGAVDLSAAATVGTDPHGTHVAGTIGSRPVADGGYGGIAPGCTLYSARVFAPGRGANQGDIANAIDALSRDLEVDLINMSLGAPTASQILHDAIIDAAERGTLCVAAAGNEAGPVGYPGGFDEVICVGALGIEGWGPAGSLSSIRLPADQALFGRDSLYFANFSCFGPEIDCVGPGVGIIASMPGAVDASEPYGGMDGTSMASPAVCGALAVLLARDAAYRLLPREENRAKAARRILMNSLRDVGIPKAYQGQGMPRL